MTFKDLRKGRRVKLLRSEHSIFAFITACQNTRITGKGNPTYCCIITAVSPCCNNCVAVSNIPVKKWHFKLHSDVNFWIAMSLDMIQVSYHLPFQQHIFVMKLLHTALPQSVYSLHSKAITVRKRHVILKDKCVDWKYYKFGLNCKRTMYIWQNVFVTL